jgi:hypothetical protein
MRCTVLYCTVLYCQRMCPGGLQLSHRAAHHLRFECMFECQHHAAEQGVTPQAHKWDEQVRGIHINSRGPVPLTTSNLQEQESQHTTGTRNCQCAGVYAQSKQCPLELLCGTR